MSLFFNYNQDKTMIIIKGKTYPYRNPIKSLGARFCCESKVWQLPYNEDLFIKVSNLCKSAGGGLLLDGSQVIKAPEESQNNDLQEEKVTFTIHEVMQKAEQIIKLKFSRPIWVTGEIQNLQRKRSGFFFDFAQANTEAEHKDPTSIKATFWDSTFKKLSLLHNEDHFKDLLNDDIQIRCLCQVNLFKNRGQVTLNIINIDIEFTKGTLALAREKLLKKLRSIGADVKNKSRHLVPLPLRIGLISANGSRAKSDFIHQLWTGGYPGTVIFFPSAMQGEKSPREISAGIKTLMAKQCDLIVITRGGGSSVDLRWFDSEELAMAIANSNVPILAAIGHHDDFCIAEEICYNRQKTPTAAADFVNQIFQNTVELLNQYSFFIEKTIDQKILSLTKKESFLKEKMSSFLALRLSVESEKLQIFINKIDKIVTHKIFSFRNLLNEYTQKLNLRSSHLLNQHQQHLEHNLKNKLSRKISEVLQNRIQYLDLVHNKILANDPKPWLEKGWTSLQRHGQRIYSVKQLEPDQILKTTLLDGSVELKVLSIQKSCKGKSL